MDERIWEKLSLGGVKMSITEKLYDLFERGFTNEMINECTKYDIEYIHKIRGLYNKFTKEC